MISFVQKHLQKKKKTFSRVLYRRFTAWKIRIILRIREEKRMHSAIKFLFSLGGQIPYSSP